MNMIARPEDKDFQQLNCIKQALMKNIAKIQLMVEIADLFSDKYLTVMECLLSADSPDTATKA